MSPLGVVAVAFASFRPFYLPFQSNADHPPFNKTNVTRSPNFVDCYCPKEFFCNVLPADFRSARFTATGLRSGCEKSCKVTQFVSESGRLFWNDTVATSNFWTNFRTLVPFAIPIHEFSAIRQPSMSWTFRVVAPRRWDHVIGGKGAETKNKWNLINNKRDIQFWPRRPRDISETSASH